MGFGHLGLSWLTITSQKLNVYFPKAPSLLWMTGHEHGDAEGTEQNRTG
jgi:hypothetical protein